MFKSDLTPFSEEQLKKKHHTWLKVTILMIVLMVAVIGYHMYLMNTQEDSPNLSLYVPIILCPIAALFSMKADTFGKELRKRKASSEEI